MQTDLLKPLAQFDFMSPSQIYDFMHSETLESLEKNLQPKAPLVPSSAVAAEVTLHVAIKINNQNKKSQFPFNI